MRNNLVLIINFIIDNINNSKHNNNVNKSRF